MKTSLFTRRTVLQQLAVAVGAGMINTSTAFGKINHLQNPKPWVISTGAGEKGSFGGIDAVFKLNKTQTAGNLDVVEMTLKPGHLAAPPHLHHKFDEICYLKEGSLHVMIGKEITEIQAGSWHIRPRGIIHTFWNSGRQPAKVIELYTPGGFEDYLRRLAKLFEQNLNPPLPKIQSLAAKYDMVIHFELLKGIMDQYQVHL